MGLGFKVRVGSCGMMVQRKGVRHAIKRAQVRLSVVARSGTLTLGKLFTPI